jgi:nitrite reductase/ring-hydroxylating ferredoxin subunit
MEKPTDQINRREFFVKGIFYSGLGAVLGVLAWIFGDFWAGAHRFSSARWVLVAPLNRFRSDSIVPFPEYKIAILRKGQKIGAISLECTHLGCLLNVVDQGFFCPCHGSDFGPLGQVYSGPATVSLPWHDIIDREDKIWVHMGQKLKNPIWLVLKENSPAGETN